MFTFTLASLLLWLLEQGEGRPRLLLLIPPLFLLWLNLHAGFALGPALLLLYALGLIFESVGGATPWMQSRAIIVRVLLITLACLALVPLNPSGLQLYRYPLETLRSTGMRSLIVEWFSPDFHREFYVPLLLVFLLLLIALTYSNARIKGRILLPLLLTAVAALDAVRHIPIFILIAIPVIAAALPSSSAAPLLSQPPVVSKSKQAIFNRAAVAFLALFAILRWVDLARDQPAREAALFPKKAVEFLQTTQQPARLFAYYDWGGYVIWRLGSKYRFFADGRADLYGDELLRQCIETVPRLQNGWEEVLETWNVQSILVPPSAAVAQALFLDPRWTTAYRDHQSVIFVRAHPIK